MSCMGVLRKDFDVKGNNHGKCKNERADLVMDSAKYRAKGLLFLAV